MVSCFAEKFIYVHKCVRDILRFVVGVDVGLLYSLLLLLLFLCYILIWTLRSSNGITVNIAGAIHIYILYDICVRYITYYSTLLLYVNNVKHKSMYAPYFDTILSKSTSN